MNIDFVSNFDEWRDKCYAAAFSIRDDVEFTEEGPSPIVYAWSKNGSILYGFWNKDTKEGEVY